ncbi:MAG TPA: peptidyl-tRNA hydrolase [Pseudonocardiaceae bacterium]|nr:peptidyl-tRNA hydrolase [Pseudonocardiaceae bacterium]
MSGNAGYRLAGNQQSHSQAAAAEPPLIPPPLTRAMPLILRMERDAMPARSALLEAAASAAVALCCDDRSQPGGPWWPEVQPWLAGRIRKVARRARGAHWVAVTELPGITVEHRGAQVRALLPWLVAQTPRLVTRLQVGGTDVPPDDAGPPPDGLPVLWLPPHPLMTVGKAAAQVGHASVLLAAQLTADRRVMELQHWAAGGYRCAVRAASASQWVELTTGDWKQRGILLVRDAGFTEVPPGTVTVAAHFPPAPA